MNCSKKNIIITGGLGFLGSYFAKILKENNFNVIILDNAKINSDSQKVLLKKKYFYKKIDITKEKQVKSFFNLLKKKKVKVNYLINNAAIDSVPKKKGKNINNLKEWNKELSVSLTGSYLMFKYFGEEMAKNNFGKIINIGSDLSVIAPNQDLYSDYKNFIKPVTYSVIKHGLLGMTKYYASLYSLKNVQVNMLSPGPIYNNHEKKFINKLIKFIPMKKMAKESDLYASLIFLLSDKNQYFTGQNLIIDGGRTII